MLCVLLDPMPGYLRDLERSATLTARLVGELRGFEPGELRFVGPAIEQHDRTAGARLELFSGAVGKLGLLPGLVGLATGGVAVAKAFEDLKRSGGAFFGGFAADQMILYGLVGAATLHVAIISLTDP